MRRLIEHNLAKVESAAVVSGINASEVMAQMFTAGRRHELAEIVTANCSGLFSELARRLAGAPAMGSYTSIDLSRVSVAALWELRKALDRITSEAAAGAVRGWECFEGLLEVLRAELAARDERAKRLSICN